MNMHERSLNLSLYNFFLYLANATMCIDEEAKQQVWNDMAYKLIEWNGMPRDELRAVFREFNAPFEELCASCNEELPEDDYVGEALCTSCIAQFKCETRAQSPPLDEPVKPRETTMCICKEVIVKPNILCTTCEALALDTPLVQFFEVENIMDKSYNGLYGHPSKALLDNYGSHEAFRRISRSSHALFGAYKNEKIAAYIEKNK